MNKMSGMLEFKCIFELILISFKLEGVMHLPMVIPKVIFFIGISNGIKFYVTMYIYQDAKGI